MAPIATAVNFILDITDSITSWVAENDVGAIVRRRSEAKVRAVVDAARSHRLAAAAARAAARAETLRRAGKAARLLLVGGGLVGGVTALLACSGYITRARKLRADEARRRLHEESGVGDRYSTAVDYRPDLRDCLPGESHDIIVEEYYDEDDDDDDGAPPGLAPPAGGEQPRPRRRAPRRDQYQIRVVRKKYRHRPYENFGITGEYLSHVVAEARVRFNGKVASRSAEEAARDFMVRMMREHGVRAGDINDNITKMVTSVFYVSPEDRAELELRQELRRNGMYGAQGVE